MPLPKKKTRFGSASVGTSRDSPIRFPAALLQASTRANVVLAPCEDRSLTKLSGSRVGSSGGVPYLECSLPPLTKWPRPPSVLSGASNGGAPPLSRKSSDADQSPRSDRSSESDIGGIRAGTLTTV